jgi:hypothetical protein
MPLGEPPAVAVLGALAGKRLAGERLHRIFRVGRSPWWFASVNGDAAAHGRFDLPEPYGACYTGTSVAASAVEAFQDHSRGVLPVEELRTRRRAVVTAPPGTPRSAQLTSARSRAVGLTAALWAGGDRGLTQRWAAQLHRAGWRALFHGVAHDPTGRLRAVTLLDRSGEHPPYDDDGWDAEVVNIEDDPEVLDALDRYGYAVIRTPTGLPVMPLAELQTASRRRRRGR